MDQKETIRAYYQYFKEKDKVNLQSILTKNFKFTSNYVSYHDRDEMLNDIWPQVIVNNNQVEDLEIFENGDRFMVKYTLVTPEKIAMCEYFRFEENQIAEIEVFSGQREKV